MKKEKILVTGASGLVGSRLIPRLLIAGHEVKILSRSREGFDGLEVYVWDIPKKQIDYQCVADVDVIIHLAGEPIAAKRWSNRQKHILIQSRVDSTALLAEALTKTDNRVKKMIAASAVGFYGDRSDEILTEDSTSGSGFLADCCVLWEEAMHRISDLRIAVTVLRFGMVLDGKKGSLPVMAKPIYLMAGAPLGDGKQWVSWIHHKDLTSMILYFIDHGSKSGTFNAVAPNPVTNEALTNAIAEEIHRPVWPIRVPEFGLKLILGEMAEIVTSSTNVSAQKVLTSGFHFEYLHIKEALKEVYG